MKRDEIKLCCLCKKGVSHNGDIVFFQVKIEQAVINLNAVRRQAGLEMQMGSPYLAAIMGPDEDLAEVVPGAETKTICQNCFFNARAAEIWEAER